MCFLHKPMNLCTATTKALNAWNREHHQQIEAARADEMAKGSDTVDDSLNDLPLGDASKAGTWALTRQTGPKHEKDNLRRGDDLAAFYKAKGVPAVCLLALKGNRVFASLRNGWELRRYIVDKKIGCAYCSVCLEEHPALAELVPASEEPVPDTHCFCLRCHLANKLTLGSNSRPPLLLNNLEGAAANPPAAKFNDRAMNRLEQVNRGTLASFSYTVETTVDGLIIEQIIDSWLRETAHMAAMDGVDYVRRVRHGLARLQADPRPFLEGKQRVMDDFLSPEWRITGDNEEARQRAKETFYMEASPRSQSCRS